jgi:TatD DNase family protein
MTLNSLELTDTHCHLDFDAFDEDRDLIIGRAHQAGVKYMINPGIDIQSSKRAIHLAEQFDSIFAAVGIHPNSLLEGDDWLSLLKELTRQSKVVAIGEIGLDYYRKTNPIDYQKRQFNIQLTIAKEVNLPIIVHSRQAGRDVIRLLSEWINKLENENSPLQKMPGVLHSFSDSFEIAHDAIELGFCLGITGPITYKNAKDLQGVIARVPLDRILIETDAPFLTPHPYRGQRNEPANTVFIAEKIAQVHNLPLERVIKQTTLNALRVFRLRDRN